MNWHLRIIADRLISRGTKITAHRSGVKFGLGCRWQSDTCRHFGDRRLRSRLGYDFKLKIGAALSPLPAACSNGLSVSPSS